jgi:hypothetical protein
LLKPEQPSSNRIESLERVDHSCPCDTRTRNGPLFLRNSGGPFCGPSALSRSPDLSPVDSAGQSLATRINRMCHQDAQQRGREKLQDHGVSGDST